MASADIPVKPEAAGFLDELASVKAEVDRRLRPDPFRLASIEYALSNHPGYEKIAVILEEARQIEQYLREG
jgi:hypothetical protein